MMSARTLPTVVSTLAAGALLVAGAAAHAAAHSEVDLGAVPSGTYQNDPMHSYLTFSYDHLGLSTPMLSFDDFTIEMNLDNTDPTKSMVSVSIDPSSIVAGSETWQGHITGPDFFDVANHPDITFQSSTIEAAGDGAYKVDGDLTIKGESKPVTLTVTINAAMNHPMSGEPVVGLNGTGTVLRSDYGLDKYVPNIGDEVTLEFTAEMVKAQ